MRENNTIYTSSFILTAGSKLWNICRGNFPHSWPGENVFVYTVYPLILFFKNFLCCWLMMVGPAPIDWIIASSSLIGWCWSALLLLADDGPLCSFWVNNCKLFSYWLMMVSSASIGWWLSALLLLADDSQLFSNWLNNCKLFSNWLMIVSSALID